MDTLTNMLYGFQVALSLENILFVFLGVLAGTIIGMLPGLGPISALALMIPLTFGMNPASALILMAGVYYGAIFGGSTSSILLNAPGVAGTVATSFDGYPMARQGKAGKALAIAAYASFIGGTVSVIALMLIAPLLAQFAISFGPAEYFALMVLGLSAVTSLADKSMVKALISTLLGLMVATIGIDAQTGTSRFTFGSGKLMDGIDFLVITLGIFAMAEILAVIAQRVNNAKQQHGAIGTLRLSKDEAKRIAPPIARGSILGFFVGVLPGAGATIASLLSYTMERKINKNKKNFGKGAVEGVAAPEAANNAACGGSFVPLLTLGIPGSGSTAVLMGALLILGVQPGPLMFQERPDVFWGFVSSMYIGNIFLLLLNLPLIPYFAKILEVPRALLISLIIVFCFIGVYGVSFSVFDLFMLIGFGVLGYIMRQSGFPVAPMILAFILGGMMEQAMRQALTISNGDWSIFIHKPISLFLLILALLALTSPLLSKVLKRPAIR